MKVFILTKETTEQRAGERYLNALKEYIPHLKILYFPQYVNNIPKVRRVVEFFITPILFKLNVLRKLPKDSVIHILGDYHSFLLHYINPQNTVVTCLDLYDLKFSQYQTFIEKNLIAGALGE